LNYPSKEIVFLSQNDKMTYFTDGTGRIIIALLAPEFIQSICSFTFPRKTNVGGLNYSMKFNPVFFAPREKSSTNINT
jgi:hypothetical protein